MSIRQHVLAIVLLPIMVTIVIPFILLLFSISSGLPWMFLYPFNFITLSLGLALISIGFSLVYKTNRAFANIGKGTLAPWAPPKHFVVVGLYGYVRNPMILGVLIILLGEATTFGSHLIFTWFIFFWLSNHIFIILWEEPNLERKFGHEYNQYRKFVRRWIPRRTPWRPDLESNNSK